MNKNICTLRLKQISLEHGNESWVNAVNADGETPLHIAAKIRNLGLLRSMLPHCTNIEAIDKLGNTVAHLLVDHRAERFEELTIQRIELLHVLISMGMNINRPNNSGWTLVHFAAKHCNVNMLKFLEKNKATFDLHTRNDGTALLIACKYKGKNVEETRTIDFLINLVSNVNATDEDGYSALHYAVEKCSSSSVMNLLEHGAEVNLRTEEHKLTPLHFAVKRKSNLSTVKMLLEAGAIVECPSDEELTPLHISILEGSSDVVRYLIDNDADVNRLDEHLQFAPLHLAIHQRREDFIELLASKGANVNTSGKDGLTPLHLATILECVKSTRSLILLGADINCRYNNQSVHEAPVKNKKRDQESSSLISKLIGYPMNDVQNFEMRIDVLLRYEANPNALTSSGWNLLHYIARLGRNTRDFMEILYEHASNSEPISGITPLHIASANNFQSIVDVLMNAGADVNAKIQYDQMPMHLALRSNHTEILKILIKRGADVNCKDTRAQLTPLQLALSENHEDAAVILIDAGADVNDTSDGKSLIHLALKTNSTKVLKALIARGVNVDCREARLQLTPLHLALLRNQGNAIEILTNAGADVNALTPNGLRPIHLALLPNGTDILKLLLDKGAYVDGKDVQLQLTPLHLALYKKYRDAAVILINAGADVNACTLDGKSSLGLALELKFLDVARLLIERGARLNNKERRDYVF